MQAVKDTVNGAAEKGEQRLTRWSQSSIRQPRKVLFWYIVMHASVGDAKQRQLKQYSVENTEKTPLTTYWGTKMDVSRCAMRGTAMGENDR